MTTNGLLVVTHKDGTGYVQLGVEVRKFQSLEYRDYLVNFYRTWKFLP